MRLLFLISVTFCSVAVYAGGCPPWLMCGKFGNLVIPDSSYSAQVTAAQAAAPAAPSVSPFELRSVDQNADVNTRIATSKTLARAAASSTVQMYENGDDTFRQQYLSTHPKPGFWGYDWGAPEK